MLKTSVLILWFWISFKIFKEKLPTESNTHNPKMEFDVMSGGFFWEDEGLEELQNNHLVHAFKFVINHRKNLIAGPENELGHLLSYKFDKQVYNIAKRHYPNWIGFDNSRCSYNPELAKRMIRIQKVAHWRLEKFLEEQDTQYPPID